MRRVGYCYKITLNKNKYFNYNVWNKDAIKIWENTVIYIKDIKDNYYIVDIIKKDKKIFHYNKEVRIGKLSNIGRLDWVELTSEKYPEYYI